VIVTVCSKSKKLNVYKSLEKYTGKISKALRCNYHFSIDNTEIDEVTNKLKCLRDIENFNLIIHPIFLFDGFLYQTLMGRFEKLNFKNIIITKPFLKEKKILDAVLNKINQDLI
tara:strand:- start:27770 stop:28111 length:342 start_codon:yes stop_codon:yes gene_type:complete